MLEQHAGDELDVLVRPVTLSRLLRVPSIKVLPRNCVFFVAKHILMGWPQSAFLELRKRGIAVIADYVDANIDVMPTEGIDVHLGASAAGASALRTKINKLGASGKEALLLHNVDERLTRQPPRYEDTNLNLIYVGASGNTIIPASLQDRIKCFAGGTPEEFAQSMPQYQRANVHYCVRPDPENWLDRRYKPFTKGLTAAWCGAAILANRGVDDAEHFLGADYPYFCDRPEEALIQDTIERLQVDIGGPIWRDALDRTDEMAERVRPERLAQDMVSIIREVTG